jgi:lactoylglutathione lyase
LGYSKECLKKNILTFNPGWNQNAENLESFTDIREIQKQLKEKGITMLSEADESTEGPAHFIIEDPDGNQILVDQHR